MISLPTASVAITGMFQPFFSYCCHISICSSACLWIAAYCIWTVTDSLYIFTQETTSTLQRRNNYWSVTKARFTQYNLLSNRFDKRLYRVYSRLSNRLYNPVWQPVERTVAVRSTRLSNRLSNVQTRLTTCLSTGWMFVYTIQPAVKPVVQPVWQPAVSCKRGIRRLALLHRHIDLHVWWCIPTMNVVTLYIRSTESIKPFKEFRGNGVRRNLAISILWLFAFTAGCTNIQAVMDCVWQV